MCWLLSHGSGCASAVPEGWSWLLSTAGKSRNYRITEYPELEGTHGDHQPRSWPGTDTPAIPPCALRALSKHSWSFGAVTIPCSAPDHSLGEETFPSTHIKSSQLKTSAKLCWLCELWDLAPSSTSAGGTLAGSLCALAGGTTPELNPAAPLPVPSQRGGTQRGIPELPGSPAAPGFLLPHSVFWDTATGF